MSAKKLFQKKVDAIEVGNSKSISALLSQMGNTGFQGKSLAKVVDVQEDMIRDEYVTILFGYPGSLSTTGQWKLVNWLIENRYIDILIPTGANISEDLVDAMGMAYWQGDSKVNDELLFSEGGKRYYDVYGKERDYLKHQVYRKIKKLL